jgi:hypothetical protein
MYDFGFSGLYDCFADLQVWVFLMGWIWVWPWWSELVIVGGCRDRLVVVVWKVVSRFSDGVGGFDAGCW